jgi:uncharacterized protein (TIGR02246 family)
MFGGYRLRRMRRLESTLRKTFACIKGEIQMSEKNKAILEEANAAIAEGNNEGFLRFCTDDTEWTFVGDQTLKGKEAVRQYMAATYTEPPKFTVENLIAEGDFLTVLGEITIKEAGGKATHYSYCDVWRFLGGKIVELKAFAIETEVENETTSVEKAIG